ncbi:response regulator [Pseudooceanicola aestuarii]|uniref:response regulator n=1 Tax=Pseudooceanicola aestuarii TaxID=2697319 RepID=UPI0013D08350|nr:response regulator transcription factor [Pseudooceanicola aestuarii]
MPNRLRHALIIDDHPLFCDALSMTLRMIVGIDAVSVAQDLGTAIAKVEADPGHDVILLDLNLPDVSGLDGLIRLKQAAGRVPVIVVSSLSEASVMRAAIAAGAAGFVPKHSPREVFQQAFQTIADGQVYLPDEIGTDAAPDEAGTERETAVERLAQLTRQQMKILELICEGKLNKQIAHDLTIAEATVKAHITAIMRKLGVQSRTQAVLIAQRANFGNLLQDG